MRTVRKKRHAKNIKNSQRNHKVVALNVVLGIIFLLELLVAFEVVTTGTLTGVAMFLAIILGVIAVVVNVQGHYSWALHRAGGLVRSIDSWLVFFALVVSILGTLFDGFTKWSLWANVCISFRWLYDAMNIYVRDWRVRNKKVLTDDDCPEKID